MSMFNKKSRQEAAASTRLWIRLNLTTARIIAVALAAVVSIVVGKLIAMWVNKYGMDAGQYADFAEQWAAAANEKAGHEVVTVTRL